jgi:hypothetical protein
MNPGTVAKIFAELLTPPCRFAGAFAEVVFAVLDRSEDSRVHRAFARRFARAGRDHRSHMGFAEHQRRRVH